MGIVSIIAWIVVGGVAGWLASMVMKTNAAQGTLMDIVVGIIGAFIGGFVLSAVGVQNDAGSFNIASLATAFVGAVILLGILKLIRR
ncbi:MAG: GlsB/YeaQ/YmgE family stress response membrane protein [Aggregatilineales bacterium]